MSDTSPSPNFEALRLGEPSEPIALDTSEQNRLATVAMLGQARRFVSIVSRHLDPPIYAHRDFVDCLRQVIVGNQIFRLRVIIRDPGPAVRSGHALLALAQRLPTFIALRVPGRPHADFNQAFLVVDERAVIVRRFADRYTGEAGFGDTKTAREYHGLFEEMWGQSRIDPNLRAQVL
jgi:hypothetical protein